MPRGGIDNPKCAMARCAQGALSCPCDKPGWWRRARDRTALATHQRDNESKLRRAASGAILAPGSGGAIGTAGPIRYARTRRSASPKARSRPVPVFLVVRVQGDGRRAARACATSSLVAVP